MNAKIRRLMQEIERRGGIVGISDALPDAMTERFLEEIIACPDCAREAQPLRPRGPSIDEVLTGIAIRRSRDH